MSHAPPPPDDPRAGEPPDDEYSVSAGVVRAAIVFEGMLAVGAYFLGEIVERPPGERIHWNWLDALWGVIAAVPLLVLLVALMRLPLGAIERLREFCRKFLIPMFREATWRQLLLICAFAGIGEEMLFRGLIQLGLADAIGGTSGTIVGIAVASITFGLAHAATRTYAIVAGLVGLYLGGVLILSGNLLVPIIAHAVYDLGAFVYLFRLNEEEADATAELTTTGDAAESSQNTDN
jgi:membrane protease YdiL (CAAX protease family)